MGSDTHTRCSFTLFGQENNFNTCLFSLTYPLLFPSMMTAYIVCIPFFSFFFLTFLLKTKENIKEEKRIHSFCQSIIRLSKKRDQLSSFEFDQLGTRHETQRQRRTKIKWEERKREKSKTKQKQNWWINKEEIFFDSHGPGERFPFWQLIDFIFIEGKGRSGLPLSLSPSLKWIFLNESTLSQQTDALNKQGSKQTRNDSF